VLRDQPTLRFGVCGAAGRWRRQLRIGAAPPTSPGAPALSGRLCLQYWNQKQNSVTAGTYRR